MADPIKGYFTPESEELLAQVIDHLIDGDKVPTWAEMFDKPIGKIAVRLLDDQLLERLPKDETGENLYFDEVNQIVFHIHDAVVNGNSNGYASAAQIASDVVFAVAPLEELITQEGEDAVKAVVGMLISWLLVK